jgi:Putative polyhydroxyalkanoic acid system protein (PHA_gran_rgn)
MARFSVEVPHEVDRTLAAGRLRGFSDRMRSRLPGDVKDIEERWDADGNLDFSFRAFGFSVSGRLENRLGIIAVAGTIPLVALPFRGRIENEIRERIREAIAPVV